MSALTFRTLGGSVNAYSPRGDYQGRIAPSGNPEGGYHVLTGDGTYRNEHVAAWAETVDDAKLAFVSLR